MGPLASQCAFVSRFLCGILPSDPFLILNGREGCVKLRGENFDFERKLPQSVLCTLAKDIIRVDGTVSIRTVDAVGPFRYVIIMLYDFAYGFWWGRLNC